MHITPTILVLDGGATSLAQKIARAIRSLGVFTLIVPANKPEIENLAPAALVLIKGEVPLAAEYLDQVDLVIDNDFFPENLPKSTVTPQLFWGPSDMSLDFILGLDAFLKTKNLPRTFTPKSTLPILIEETKKLVGEEKVLLALSGGVDSSVCAALIHQAIGSHLVSMFVDHGLIRLGEADELAALAKTREHFNLTMVDAQKRFLHALVGISDPEEKRKTIGRVFIEVFEDEAKTQSGLSFLGQGTIYPDIIESVASVHGGTPVKSHHNVGGLPERLNLKLLEPVKYLFKDEVRALGLELGLAKEMVFRQPFPGPGLGVRCVGEITEEKLDLLRQADFIVRQEIETSGHTKPWQYFAMLLPTKSVGVREHARSMGYACVIRAVETKDAMTALPSELPFALLRKMADRIMAEAPGFSRVLYDLSAKPSATIEWE